jgi:hypothetical protein
MAFYLFNFSTAQAAEARPPREHATELLRAEVWGIDPDTPHRDALSPGDLVLLYVAAPDRVFIGRAQLASPVRVLTSTETHAYRGDLRRGVVLSQVEEWDPPVPMETVLARVDPAENARADFPVGVVRITPHEYETAVAVAAQHRKGRSRDPG